MSQLSDLFCLIAAFFALKALLWVGLISLAHWVLLSDILEE